MVNDHMSVRYQYLYNTEDGEPYSPRPGDVLESPDGVGRVVIGIRDKHGTHDFECRYFEAASVGLIRKRLKWPVWGTSSDRDWTILAALVNAFGWKVLTRGEERKEPARE